MYFDEDGDLAHEFYEEVFLDRQGKKRVMRKQERNLIAQVKRQFSVSVLVSSCVFSVLSLHLAWKKIAST